MPRFNVYAAVHGSKYIGARSYGEFAALRIFDLARPEKPDHDRPRRNVTASRFSLFEFG
jgi:hypothetical protein